jgi:hypothetical protein
MVEHLRQTVAYLKDRVQRNLELIRENNREINKILNEPVSDKRSERIDHIRDCNKRYLMENEEAIRIQHSIVRFLNRYRKNLDYETQQIEISSRENNSEKKIDREETLKRTISGEIPYNKRHPFFGDTEFKEKLIDYYKSIEDYETCAWLIKTDTNSKVHKRKRMF